MCISGEYTRTQSIDGIIGDGDGFGCALESRHAHNRPEDFLLEDSHLVVPSEDSRLHIVSTEPRHDR